MFCAYKNSPNSPKPTHIHGEHYNDALRYRDLGFVVIDNWGCWHEDVPVSPDVEVHPPTIIDALRRG